MASTQDMKVVNIGTRRSQLAIAQVDMVVKHLQTPSGQHNGRRKPSKIVPGIQCQKYLDRGVGKAFDGKETRCYCSLFER
jgi:hypothetical protein